MATKTISQLTAASTPLNGEEIVPIVQSGITSQTTVAAISPKVSSTAVAGTPVTNTTTTTTLVNVTLPANIIAGDVFQLKAWGTLTNSSGSSVNYTFSEYFGTSIIMNTGAISFATSANPRKWSADLTIVVDNTSTSSSSHAISLVVSDALTTGISIQTLSGGGIKAVGDITSAISVASRLVSFSVAMGTASASASIVCDGYVFTRIR